MIEDVIRFNEPSGDLARTPEYWQKESFEARSESIVNTIVNLTGFPPSPNMKYIREGVFGIKPDTTMEELQELASRIKESCVIDCFQIAIDREKNECHMLFDWYDRKNVKAYHLYKSKQISLSVLILRVLDIPMQLLSDVWVVHYMTQLSREIPGIADMCQDTVAHSKYRKALHQFMMLSLIHSKKVCASQRY